MSKARSSAAVLVLTRDENREVLLIERSVTVKTHQGQVAFPGGGVEEQDQGDSTRTALRECEEEVGISARHIKVGKALSPIPTLTSNFFVVPVLGFLETESELKLDPHEVAHAEWVSIEALLKTHQTEYGFPVYEWSGKDGKKRKVWGLTAIIFQLIFHSSP